MRQELIDYYERCVTFDLNCRFEDWEYKVENGLILLTKYYGKIVSDLTIPDGFDGLCNGAIDKLSNKLKKLNLNNIIKLEANSFNGFKIEEIIAPNLEYIEENSFGDCKYLKKFTGNKVKGLGLDAFRNCYLLESVILPEVVYIENSAFMECSKLKEAYIPKIEYIGSFAFAGCDDLHDISINLGTIFGDGAFRWCSKLKKNY